MDVQPPRNGSREPEALQTTEGTFLQTSRQLPLPYLVSDENVLLHYWRILKKRRWTIVVTAAIIFTLTVIATLRTTPIYQATSKVAIFPETPNVLGFKNLDDSAPVWQ